MVSQVLVRPAYFGSQVTDARQWPYAADRDYLIDFETWLADGVSRLLFIFFYIYQVYSWFLYFPYPSFSPCF